MKTNFCKAAFLMAAMILSLSFSACNTREENDGVLTSGAFLIAFGMNGETLDHVDYTFTLTNQAGVTQKVPLNRSNCTDGIARQYFSSSTGIDVACAALTQITSLPAVIKFSITAKANEVVKPDGVYSQNNSMMLIFEGNNGHLSGGLVPEAETRQEGISGLELQHFLDGCNEKWQCEYKIDENGNISRVTL